MEKDLFEWVGCDQADIDLLVFSGVTRKSDGEYFEFANLDLENGILEYGSGAGVCERWKLELVVKERLE